MEYVPTHKGVLPVDVKRDFQETGKHVQVNKLPEIDNNGVPVV
jgi:hypothetical protein